jgi:hypothetical protein
VGTGARLEYVVCSHGGARSLRVIYWFANLKQGDCHDSEEDSRAFVAAAQSLSPRADQVSAIGH